MIRIGTIRLGFENAMSEKHVRERKTETGGRMRG